MPLTIPDGAKVSVQGDTVNVEGPAGKLQVKVLRFTSVSYDPAAKKITVQRTSNIEQAKMNHGTMRAHLRNALEGVTKGFEKQLRVSGIGYQAKVVGDKLQLTLGYSHPIEMTIPAELKVTTPDPSLIVVKGANRCLVGQFAAEVRSKRVVEPYNLKGIKYEDEVVKKKQGKTFVSGA